MILPPHKRMDTGAARDASQRGAVLVMMLWLMMILMLLVLGLVRSARVSATLGYGQVERVQADWLARAGVEQALALLAADVTAEDGQGDLWHESPEDFADIALAQGYTFSVQAPALDGADPTLPRSGIEDLSSRFNVNSMREAQLARMPGITQQQADALLDWIDNNEEARPGGAERGYYSQLDIPYDIRNVPLRTVREMLLVKDITPEAFLGEDGNQDGVLQRNENDADLSWPADNADRSLTPGLGTYITVHTYELNQTPLGTPRINLKQADAASLETSLRLTPGLAQKVVEAARGADDLFALVGQRGDEPVEDETLTNEITMDWLAGAWESLTLEQDERLPGKVNVNTASRAVLESVPQMQPEMVQAIIGYRGSQGAFTGVGMLLRSNVLTEEQFRRVADFLTVRSEVFSVRSVGRTPSGTTSMLVTIIDRNQGRPAVLEWRSQ